MRMISTKASVTKLKALSAVFPCYNEEENIQPLIKEALKVFPKVAEKFEIVLVNDGSKDNTLKIASQLAQKHPEIKIISQENQGFGGALNTGLQNAKYDWVFYSDADLQFDLSELKKFIPFTAANDLVIGYRTTRAEGFKRWFFAKGMKIWNTVLIGFPWFVKDIDCAFKLINKNVIISVGPLVSKGNLVSTEFLFSAYKLGFKFKQLGVSHYTRKFGISKCGGVKDVVKVVKETFKLLGVLNEKSIKMPVLRPNVGFLYR